MYYQMLITRIAKKKRFDSTLKNMLRAYCVNNKKNRDQCIPFLMFVVRDKVQERLGFKLLPLSSF